MIDHRLLNDRLAEAMSTLTGKPVRVLEGPETDLGEGFSDLLPYAFIEPLGGAIYQPEYGGVWRQGDIAFAFLSFGTDAQSASWMASLMRSRFLDQHIYAMTLTGFDVMERRPDGGPDTPVKVANGLWSVREPVILQICAQ